MSSGGPVGARLLGSLGARIHAIGRSASAGRLADWIVALDDLVDRSEYIDRVTVDRG